MSCSSSGGINCISTASGNCHSVFVAVSCAGWEFTPNQHQHGVTITKSCIDTNCFLLMMSMTCSKHVENYKEINKYIERNLCVKLDNYQESLCCQFHCYGLHHDLPFGVFRTLSLGLFSASFLLDFLQQVIFWALRHELVFGLFSTSSLLGSSC